MTLVDWEDVAIRAIKTSIQTFAALVPVEVLMSGNPQILKSALVAAASAGVSVLWNAVVLWSSTNSK